MISEGRAVQRDLGGCHPPLQRGVRTEQPGPVHEDAVGGPGRLTKYSALAVRLPAG